LKVASALDEADRVQFLRDADGLTATDETLAAQLGCDLLKFLATSVQPHRSPWSSG